MQKFHKFINRTEYAKPVGFGSAENVHKNVKVIDRNPRNFIRKKNYCAFPGLCQFVKFYCFGDFGHKSGIGASRVWVPKLG